MTARRPADGQIVLESDVLRVEVMPAVGARLHSLRAYGHEVLRSPEDEVEHRHDPFFWGAYPMVPWCNRIEARTVQVGSRRIDLPPSFRDGTAIHGQAHAASWQLDKQSGELWFRGGGDGWPWQYLATAAFELSGPRLRVRQVVCNESNDAMPAGLGLHPWFRKPVQIRIAATTVYGSNTDPAAVASPTEGGLDLRQMGAMATDLDATWTGLSDPAVELWWPDIGVRAQMSIATATPYVAAASPSDLYAVAVEPQTHAPYGLRRLLDGEPGGLEWLAPGDSLALTTDLTFSQSNREGAT
jgi:aldose 1-epimerase